MSGSGSGSGDSLSSSSSASEGDISVPTSYKTEYREAELGDTYEKEEGSMVLGIPKRKYNGHFQCSVVY